MRATIAFAVLAFAGCKSAPQPSPEYAQAKQLYDAAYAELEEDCFDDPRVRQAESLLRRVRDDSADFAATLTLLATIEQGRKDLLARRKEEAVEARAAAPPPEEPSEEVIVPSAGTVGLDAPEGEEAPTSSSPLPIGASIAQFQSKYGDCTEKKMPFEEQGETGKKGDAWGITVGKEADCERRFPELKGNLWLFSEDKLLRPTPAKTAQVREVTEKKAPPPNE